jgi:hypothetical protein
MGYCIAMDANPEPSHLIDICHGMIQNESWYEEAFSHTSKSEVKQQNMMSCWLEVRMRFVKARTASLVSSHLSSASDAFYGLFYLGLYNEARYENEVPKPLVI